jgi:4'-phosphopantetheinyl transferase
VRPSPTWTFFALTKPAGGSDAVGLRTALPRPAHECTREALTFFSPGARLEPDPDRRGARGGAHRGATRSRPLRRRHFVSTRGASRQILGAYLGRPASDLAWSAGPNGKPCLVLPAGSPDLRFNVSHSGDLALLAVTRRRPVGVDVELMRTDGDVPAAARRFFPPEEVDALHAAPPERRGELYGRLWVRKEVCVKAAGGRLGQGLALPVGTEPGTVSVRDSRAAGLGGPWTAADLPVPAGYAAAVAVEGSIIFTTFCYPSLILRKWTQIYSSEGDAPCASSDFSPGVIHGRLDR